MIEIITDLECLKKIVETASIKGDEKDYKDYEQLLRLLEEDKIDLYDINEALESLNISEKKDLIKNYKIRLENKILKENGDYQNIGTRNELISKISQIEKEIND